MPSFSQTMYVVMIDDQPLFVASSPEAARAETVARVTRRAHNRDRELRWDERGDGEWRLMDRTGGRGRFAWTLYWVAAVPTVEGGAR